MGQWLFGCDICQDVCPWNHDAPRTKDDGFLPLDDLAPADAAGLLRLTPEQFEARFQHSPLSRPKRSGLLRNAAIVLGNSGDRQAIPALIAVLDDEEPLVRGAAAWALGQLGGVETQQTLEARLAAEVLPEVTEEIRSALVTLAAGIGG
jgi:epoxyqueuosine reductase